MERFTVLTVAFHSRDNHDKSRSDERNEGLEEGVGKGVGVVHTLCLPSEPCSGFGIPFQMRDNLFTLFYFYRFPVLCRLNSVNFV